MTPEYWSHEEEQRLMELQRQKVPIHEIAQEMGRGYSSVRHKLQRMREKAQANETTPSVVKEFDAAAQRATQAESVTVTPLWSASEVNVADLWRQAEEDSAGRIEKARLQSKFKVNLPSSRVTAVSFLSDQHIAPGTPVDFRRMREDAELIAATRDVYAILGGDACDNHIKHHSAIIAARSQPHDQFQLYEHYLTILKESLLVVTSGNHDLWTNQYAGIDMVSWLCRQGRYAYAPYEARIEATAGSQVYRLAVRHQYRLNSSFNQTHSVKQWLRLGEDDFDVGCIGHHHEAAVEQTIYRGRVVWCCRPGSYQITSAYSMQYGWNAALPTCPTFLLFPDKKHIIGLHDVRDAPKILKALNG